jgi:hypothetical protein
MLRRSSVLQLWHLSALKPAVALGRWKRRRRRGRRSYWDFGRGVCSYARWPAPIYRSIGWQSVVNDKVWETQYCFPWLEILITGMMHQVTNEIQQADSNIRRLVSVINIGNWLITTYFYCDKMEPGIIQVIYTTVFYWMTPTTMAAGLHAGYVWNRYSV